MLPVIDIQSPLAAKAIREACINNGFFYVINHKLESDITTILSQTRDFFTKISLENKLKLRTNLCGRGYEPPTIYVHDDLNSIPETKRKRKESYMIGREVSEDEMAKWGLLPFSSIGVNQWPENQHDFRHYTQLYFQKCWALSRILLRLFSNAVGKEDSFFEPNFINPTVMLRLIRYLPERSSPDKGIYAAGPHTDYGMFTLLCADNTPGLQIFQNGIWQDVLPLKGAFICNVGDALAIATKHQFKATEHRVVIDGSTERFSVAFFFEPSLDTPLETFAIDSQLVDHSIEEKNEEEVILSAKLAPDEESVQDTPFKPKIIGNYLSHLQRKCQETHDSDIA